MILIKPDRHENNQNLASIIKKRVQEFSDEQVHNHEVTSYRTKYDVHSDENLARIITSKIDDGNIRAALRILLSDDKPAEDNNITFAT